MQKKNIHWSISFLLTVVLISSVLFMLRAKIYEAENIALFKSLAPDLLHEIRIIEVVNKNAITHYNFLKHLESNEKLETFCTMARDMQKISSHIKPKIVREFIIEIKFLNGGEKDIEMWTQIEPNDRVFLCFVKRASILWGLLQAISK